MKPIIIYTGITQPITNIPQYDFYHLPTIGITYCDHLQPNHLEHLLDQQPAIVFFSKNGVIGSKKAITRLDLINKIKNCSIYSVGEATTKIIADQFNIVAHQATPANARGMIKTFEKLTPRQVIIFSGSKSRREFPQWLTENRWDFTQICVYKTEIVHNIQLKQIFNNNEQEYIIFSSPSTIDGFLLSIGKDSLLQIKSQLVAIGPSTSQAIIDHRGKVWWQTKKPKLDTLLGDLNEMLGNKK